MNAPDTAKIETPSAEPQWANARPGRRAGARSVRLTRVRRRRRQRFVLLVVGLAAVAVIASMLTGSIAPQLGAVLPKPQPGLGGAQDTLLLVRHPQGDDVAEGSGLEEGGQVPASGVTLFAAGPDEAPAVVLSIPVGTLVEIPGFGLDQLAVAYRYGGAPLVESTLENTLGIEIDHVAAVDDSGLAALLDRVGDRERDVGQRLTEYWEAPQQGEDELATLQRQQQALAVLLTTLRDAEAREAFVGDGAPQLDTRADAQWLDALVRQLAEASAAGRLGFEVLPVNPIGEEGASSYRLQEEAMAMLVEDRLAASVLSGGGMQALRIQVLNGVGRPGIGQEVDQALDGGPFRIVLTDNARSFDFAETLILIYDETERSMDAARQVQDRLGVGTIQVHRRPQTVVDLTVVVGADFRPRAE